MRTVWASLVCLLACLPFGRSQGSVYRLWTKAELFDRAASHASRYSVRHGKGKCSGLRYFDLAGTPPRDRARKLAALSFALNSLSRSDVVTLPAEVPGTEGALAYIDVKELLIDPAVLDRLGKLGSGPAAFPEPYYHQVKAVEITPQPESYEVEEQVRTYDPRYGGYVISTRRVTKYREVGKRVKKKEVALAGHLNETTVVGLVALLKTEFPVFEADWFMANALTEPRYHEILGLDDSIKSVEKLAGLDEKEADKRGAQLRGAVTVSEVAHRNRILERTPLAGIRHGRGVFHKSYDFNTSVLDKDVLKDPLKEKSDANEIIWSLPNGLLGYFVTDGNGKRLDVAAADVALNNRGKWKDRQVRTAVHCIDCHMKEKGWIEVNDEVRALAEKPVKLAIDDFNKAGREDDAVRLRQKYLDAPYNELLRADQVLVEASVKAACKVADAKALTPAEVGRLVAETVRVYWEVEVTLARLAVELGVPQDDLAKAIRSEGLDPVFALIASRGQGRRDQVEAGFAQIAGILYLGGK